MSPFPKKWSIPLMKDTCNAALKFVQKLF